ncbi:MAG: penicillin-binding protein activator [Piscirickettsiaceae bacterium]|nr:penicillin-binding protein activator [Piscirickettsiaceae bacterium]
MPAEKVGDHLETARQYNDLADFTHGTQQAQLYSHAMRSYFQINQLDQAMVMFNNIDKKLLSRTRQLNVTIIESRIILSLTQAEQALAALEPYEIKHASTNQQQAVYRIKIKAYGITKNWLKKANIHIALSNLLSNKNTMDNNKKVLWQTLMKLSLRTLKLFHSNITPTVNNGWFTLAYTVRAYKTNPDRFIMAIRNWQSDYPNHYADSSLYKRQLKIDATLPQLPKYIAILLPRLGPYKAASNAIKQGIIAAHFSEETATNLQFFTAKVDSVTRINNIWQRYKQAIMNKADLVIGPLDKISVQVLANAEKLPIPVLALNRLNYQSTQKHNLFQFGLAPEEDAIAAANFAIEKGYERAVILAPYGHWGNRIAEAFRNKWLVHGGIVLNQVWYDRNKNDFSAVIKLLLSLDHSKQRQQNLKLTIGKLIEFKPRRRQDVDFIFFIAHPLKARQLLTQLKFYRAGQLPIIATSHAYNGQENIQQNIDLNGLIINDIPWIFNDLNMYNCTYITLKESSPLRFHQFIRLYALGADAYRLIPNLDRLSRHLDLSFKGATGILSINRTGHLKRKTRWAKFDHGKIRVLLQ